MNGPRPNTTEQSFRGQSRIRNGSAVTVGNPKHVAGCPPTLSPGFGEGRGQEILGTSPQPLCDERPCSQPSPCLKLIPILCALVEKWATENPRLRRQNPHFAKLLTAKTSRFNPFAGHTLPRKNRYSPDSGHFAIREGGGVDQNQGEHQGLLGRRRLRPGPSERPLEQRDRDRQRHRRENRQEQHVESDRGESSLF